MDIRTRTRLGLVKIIMLKGEKGDKGDDGSSGDYALLTNKPTINGTTVDGALTSGDLSLASASGLADVESDVSGLQSDVSGLQSDVSGLQSDVANVLNLVYPVGSIYMSVNAVSPATLFGGTWVKIEDTFLLASGSNYALGSSGGEKTHTLTENEIPSHRHTVKYVYYNRGSGSSQTFGYISQNGDNIGYSDYTGGGNAHNNMPPYLAVNMWKRTA